ncbi:hypothetical protein pdam_00024008, partial [Pocillopora damicornis]
MRNNGGIAIYIRNNLTVKLAFLTRTSLISVRNVDTATRKPILLILDEHPQTVVICGGDLNKLNIGRLEELTGWNAIWWIFRQEAFHA